MRKHRRRRLAALTLAAILVPAGVPSGAAATGRVRVHASMELRETYDSNAFLIRGPRIGDFYTTLSPRLSLTYRGPRIAVDAESGASFFVYGRLKDLNDQFFDERLRVEYKIAPRLYLEAEDTYTSVSRRVGRPDDLASNLVQSNTWHIGPIFRSDLGGRSRMEVKADYGTTNYVNGHFENGQTPDFQQARTSLYIEREVSEAITVYTSQEFTRRDFSQVENASFTGLLSTIGLRWGIGRRLSLDASGGKQWLHFGGPGTENGSIVDLALHWSPTQRTRVTAAYDQVFTSDVDGKLYRQKRYTLGLERRIGPRTLLRANSFYSEFTQSIGGFGNDNYFGGNVKLEHKLLPRLLVDLGWSYAANAGGLSTDNFDRNLASMGIRYEY
ncbi:MAG: hypothetical protein A2Y95_08795 [Deltaproteobacteria bacterium RBG_13_65_10]|nr:MAG: hypothetical protein A2Y95_08795 [Deltaproteobacteria bacterium RBG_13_65_10]